MTATKLFGDGNIVCVKQPRKANRRNIRMALEGRLGQRILM